MADPRARAASLALLGAALALAPALALSGFIVDDAWIPARYAFHLRHGLGYRFNASGPVTDGVTPLGFPYLLAPFAVDVKRALLAAKAIGVVAWTIGAAALGVAIHRASERRARYVGFALVACSAPLAAWAGAGLETGLATGLAALAVVFGERERPRARAALAGLAAALRPELVPWAIVIGAAPSNEAGVARRAAHTALALAPFAIVCAVRLVVFGRVAPLSIYAKPSDLEHGLTYAAACALLTGPIAIVAPIAWTRFARWPRYLVASIAVHFLSIAAAGGDWMPLSRLVVPVLPAVALAAAHVASVADVRATFARVALALAGELFAFVKVGPVAARVGEERARMAREVAPALEGARVVAALDIGWIGGSTDATIVDLAGLTDPSIASLPGGHTSKAIPATLLDARRVDTLVLRVADGADLASPWNDSRFASAVEDRVASIPGVGDEFHVVATSDVPHLRYVVARRALAP